MKKSKVISIEDFNPVVESFDKEPYIVEFDSLLQPAVALQSYVSRFGVDKMLSGYSNSLEPVVLTRDPHELVDHARESVLNTMSTTLSETQQTQVQQVAKKSATSVENNDKGDVVLTADK